MSLEPQRRSPLWRGHVTAHALLFDPALVGEAEARRRVAAAWAPGARVEEIAGHGLLVHLATPRRVRAEAAEGLPLVRVGGVLSGVDAGARQLERLGARTGDLVLARGGVVAVAAARSAVDPSRWLVLDELALAAVQPLGAAAPVAAAPAPPAILDARSALGGAIPPRAERPGAEAALAKPVTAAPGGPSFLARLRAWLARSLARLAGAGSGRARPAPASRQLGGAAGPGPEPILLPAPPRSPGWLHRLRERLAAAAARLAALSQLDRVIGRRQAEYVARMLRHFERGEWDQALRHGIPLDEVGKPGAPRPPSLTVPRPRDNLEIGARGEASTSLGMGSDLFAHVRRTYRAAFERLAAAGQHERAAFVLAELLDANEEAVAYLETHGLLREAARLAEARHLPPGLVVRQWILARDPLRALALARVHGVFADAVARLDKTHKDAASALRTLWADSLASAGEYAAAVTVAWADPALRPVARAWIDRAIALGGTTGGAMLAHKLTLVPEAAAETVATARALLAGDDPAARLALARGLTAPPDRPGLLALRRLAARTLVRDAGLGLAAEVLPSEIEQLARLGGDPALAADVPRLLPSSPLVRLVDRTAPLTHTVHAADTGREPVHDAARLPDGRLLVAVGEAGVLLYDRRGRLVHRFDEPAHALAPADAGHAAIAVARRGRGQLIAKLDLHTRRSARFWEAALNRWAPTHDGSLWFVASGEPSHDTIFAIDVQADAPRALWSLDVGDDVSELRHQASKLHALVGWSSEEWEWELPGLVLRKRAKSTQGRFFEKTPEEVMALIAHDDFWRVERRVTQARQWLQLTGKARQPLLTVDGLDNPSARVAHGHLVLSDERGRVLVFDLRDGRLVTDLRT